MGGGADGFHVTMPANHDEFAAFFDEDEAEADEDEDDDDAAEDEEDEKK